MLRRELFLKLGDFLFAEICKLFDAFWCLRSAFFRCSTQPGQRGVALEADADVFNGHAINRDGCLHPGFGTVFLIVREHLIEAFLRNLQADFMGNGGIKNIDIACTDIDRGSR